MIITVTPSPAIDWTIHLENFALDAVNRIADGSREASGKGLNVSWALHRSGIATTAVFPGGGNTGQFMSDALDDADLAHIRVPTGTEVRTNITLVTPGHSTKLNEPGVRLDTSVLDELTRRAVEAGGHAELVLVCGSLPTDVPRTFVGDLITAVTAQGAQVAVDMSGLPLRDALAARPGLIKPNVHELAELTGQAIHSQGDVVSAARLAIADGAGAVLASLGADGAMYIDAAHALRAAARDIPFVNSVGAGDALLAGFVAGPGGPEERLHRAVLWASSAVSYPTTLFTVRPEFSDRISVEHVCEPYSALAETSAPLS